MSSVLDSAVQVEVSEIVECFRESVTVFALYNTRESLLAAFRPEKNIEFTLVEAE